VASSLQSLYYTDFLESTHDGENPTQLACHRQRRPRRSKPPTACLPQQHRPPAWAARPCGEDSDAGGLHLLQRTGPTTERLASMRTPKHGDLDKEALGGAKTLARYGRTACSTSLGCYSPVAWSCACQSTLGAPRFTFSQINHYRKRSMKRSLYRELYSVPRARSKALGTGTLCREQQIELSAQKKPAVQTVCAEREQSSLSA
jgi:hypothetical protein